MIRLRNVLEHICDKFVEDYDTRDIHPLLKDYFNWDRSEQLDPTQVREYETAEDLKQWTMFFRSRHEPGVSESRLYKPVVSIKKSQLKNSGYGLFAEQEFLKDDIISVYLGSLNESPQEDLSVYSVNIKRQNKGDVNLDVEPEDMLFLGAHYANDINFKFPGSK